MKFIDAPIGVRKGKYLVMGQSNTTRKKLKKKN